MYTSHNIGRHGIWKPWHCSLTWIKFCWNLVNTCWPKTYLNQNKRIWCFISSMCVFKGKWLVNKWSVLFQKGTLLSVFFFHARVDPEANFCHMTMLYISFLISRTMRNFWSGQIFYLTSRKFFWDSRSGLMRQIFGVMLT